MSIEPHPEELEPLVIEPCQFCGSNKVEPVKCPIGFKPGRKVDAWVACRACGASGPVAPSIEVAVNWWNLGKPDPEEEKQEGKKA